MSSREGGVPGATWAGEGLPALLLKLSGSSKSSPRMGVRAGRSGFCEVVLVRKAGWGHPTVTRSASAHTLALTLASLCRGGRVAGTRASPAPPPPLLQAPGRLRHSPWSPRPSMSSEGALWGAVCSGIEPREGQSPPATLAAGHACQTLRPHLLCSQNLSGPGGRGAAR